MSLLDYLKDALDLGGPLGGYWHCTCPKCGTKRKIPKGDIVCWISFSQYAKACGYPKCPNCGTDMKG